MGIFFRFLLDFSESLTYNALIPDFIKQLKIAARRESYGKNTQFCCRESGNDNSFKAKLPCRGNCVASVLTDESRLQAVFCLHFAMGKLIPRLLRQDRFLYAADVHC